MKRQFDWTAFWRGFRRGWIQGCVVAVVVGVLMMLFGCTPTIKQPLKVRCPACKPDLPVQRTEDLQFPCDICGQPAKMCPVENWYRCDECSKPRNKPKRIKSDIRIAGVRSDTASV